MKIRGINVCTVYILKSVFSVTAKITTKLPFENDTDERNEHVQRFAEYAVAGALPSKNSRATIRDSSKSR